MRIARYATAEGNVGFGVVDGLGPDGVPNEDTYIAAFNGHPFGEIEPNGRRLELADVRLLAPVLPSKVVAIGKNYADHVAEMGGEIPPEPVLFLKPSTSVVGPGDAIVLPRQSRHVEHEAELAVVIGRLCRDVPVERARDVILGYTCANDVTARDLQKSDGQWARAKGFDTFCPLGPWISTDADPESGLSVRCEVDGELRQQGSTSDLIRGVAELIAYVSAAMTLLPGDVLLTGTPAGVSPLTAGQSVSVTISAIGTLTNRIVSRD